MIHSDKSGNLNFPEGKTFYEFATSDLIFFNGPMVLKKQSAVVVHMQPQECN